MKLADIPVLRFGQREDYAPIGALRALLRHQGLDVPYPTLMAISGAAFRHAWSGHSFSISALLASPEPVLPPVIEAYGLKAQRLDLRGDDAGWSQIVAVIATGRPVLFWGGRHWRSAGLIFGYDEWPSALWARTYTDRDDAGRQIQFAAWRQMAAEGIEVWAFELSGAKPRHDTFAIFNRAVQVLQCPGDDQHQFGIAAYESWARAVESAPPLPGSREATVCQAAVRTLIDARRAAGIWLQGLPRPQPSSLQTVADSYTDYRYLLGELVLAFQHVTGPDDGKRIAKRIRAAAQEDARALSALRATISIVVL